MKELRHVSVAYIALLGPIHRATKMEKKTPISEKGLATSGNVSVQFTVHIVESVFFHTADY